MNKEILEITKKFHDTYEKLASEYTYETREDTKVFDINSNNGKLMYATVNEIVSPILKENEQLKADYGTQAQIERDMLQQENKILRENAENNDKVVAKVNWENQSLKKQLEELKDLIDTILNFSFFKEECPLNFGFENNTNEDKSQSIFYEDEWCENNCNDNYKDCWLKYFKKLQELEGSDSND